MVDTGLQLLAMSCEPKATTCENVYLKIRNATKPRQHGNTILSKKECELLIADRDVCETLKAKQQSELDCIQRLANATQNKVSSQY